MMFTLIIWVVSMLLLLLAMILYLFFLWHHIHNETLNGFCRRKVETRLERIVKAKTEKIWAKQQAKRAKEEAKNGKVDDTDDLPQRFQRQPTLPTLGESSTKVSELSRTDSMATLPPYTSKPGTPLDADRPPLPRQPTLPDFGLSNKPGLPHRSFTSSSAISTMSYGSRTSLLGDASPIGYSDPASLYRTSINRSYGGSSPSLSPSYPLPRSTPTQQPQYIAYSPSAAPNPTTAGPRRSQTTSPTSSYEPPQSYEMAPLPNDAYIPQQSRSPAPRGSAFGPPVDRRLGEGRPAMSRSQTPGVRNFAYPRPTRSVTAPLPGGGMEGGTRLGNGGRSFTRDGTGWV
jgi:hypothetical protein